MNALAKALGRIAPATMARVAFLSIPVWMALSMLARAAHLEQLADATEMPFLFFCHRIPERTLSIGGVAMPLCSRCAGVWLGLAGGVIAAWPVFPIRALRWITIAAAVFMLGEVVTQDLHWHPVFHPTRIFSGVLLAWPIGAKIADVIRRDLPRQII